MKLVVGVGEGERGHSWMPTTFTCPCAVMTGECVKLVVGMGWGRERGVAAGCRRRSHVLVLS